MTAPTKKELIIRRYVELSNVLKQHIDAGLFPSVEEVDVVDLIMYINVFFETAGDYRSGLRTLIGIKNLTVSDETFEILYPHVAGFLDWLRELR
jgi:hypothetical protein